MKKIFFILLITAAAITKAEAQHIRARLNFPVGVTIGAPGRPPFAGGIWIGPEWRWQGRNYVYVPGYWARPHKAYKHWVAGHWQETRRGFRWIPGHWR